MRRVALAVFFGLSVAVISANNVFADPRRYVWTYEYQTMHKGKSEIELYETVKIPKKSDSGIKTFEHWVEYEYGVTDRFDLGIYQMWKTKDTRDKIGTKYDGTKLRLRYRFGEKNKYIVDPLVYFEYKRSAKTNDPHKAEVKLILAKDMGRFNVSYNQIANLTLEKRSVVENEYAVALSFKPNKRLSLGFESKGTYNRTKKFYLGPTVALRLNKFWVAAGLAVKLNKRADDVQLRTIVGIPF